MKPLMSLFLTGSLVFIACNQSEPKSTTKIKTVQQANDRPSEESADVPGYAKMSIKCLPDESNANQLEVGCLLSLEDGSKADLPTGAWTQFEIRYNTKPEALTIEKKLPNDNTLFSIIFVFSGGSLEERQTLLNLSTFIFEYESTPGSIATLETGGEIEVQNPVQTPDATCTIGTELNGSCYFKTSQSCSKQCEDFGLQVDPSVQSVIGSANDQNAQTCLDLYSRIENRNDFELELIRTPFGVGCHQFNDKVLWDRKETNVSVPPPVGASRLCACQ
ncbi:MAG: hypothetical protein HRU19_23430 [Pseudobacteriovorax sp.]|nr:hypothetical protein [Pseudobacteriovorax sp.]